MAVKEPVTPRPPAGEILRIFSPLLVWLGFAVHLTFFSRLPFLRRWLDGSFALFVALVLCNLLRRHRLGNPSDEEPPGPPPGTDRD